MHSSTSFRAKIVRATVMALFLGLTVSAVAIVVLHTRQEVHHLEQELEVLANILGNRSAAALVFGDRDAAERNIGAARFKSSIQTVCLYAQNGELFSRFSTNGSPLLCPEIARVAAQERGVVQHTLSTTSLVAEIREGGDVLGTIYVIAENRFLWESAARFLGLTTLVTIIVLLTVLAVISSVLRRAMQPLEELTDLAGIAGQDALTPARARSVRTGDEVGELVETFNDMLDNINQRHAALLSSEARFRALSEHAPVGVFQTDAGGSITYSNAEWRSIVGQANGPSTRKELAQGVSEAFRELYEDYWRTLRDRREPQVIEYRYVRPSDRMELFLMEYAAALFDDDGKLTGYVGTLIDVTELKTAQMELEKLAFYDALTELPNRRFFRDHLAYVITRAVKEHEVVAVLMIDLDNFKNVNDLLGHDAGDDLLKEVAHRIRGAIFEQDLVSRLGGDEFLVLVTGVENSSRVAQITSRIQTALGEPIDIDGHQFELTASMGVSVFPDDATSAEQLVKNADFAMYDAKSQGKDTTRYYSQKLDHELKTRLRLQMKLRHAVTAEDFEIHLQPQYSVADDQVIAAEALMRWPDKDEGMISPVRFIPLAEELGLIVQMGDWLLEQICRNIRENQAGMERAGLRTVALNLSARQLFSTNFLANTRHIIDNAGVAPEAIEFELTESVVMDDAERAIRLMTGLRDMGCSLSMDDFGTGYSSLAYLKRFPLNSLKIDRTFVRDLPHSESDIEICTATIAMAHKLGLKVIAEGVETEAQKALLIEQSCDLLQGYLIGRPTEIGECMAKVRRPNLRVLDGWASR